MFGVFLAKFLQIRFKRSMGLSERPIVYHQFPHEKYPQHTETMWRYTLMFKYAWWSIRSNPISTNIFISLRWNWWTTKILNLDRWILIHSVWILNLDRWNTKIPIGEDLNPQALARSIGLDGKPPLPPQRSEEIVRPGFPVLIGCVKADLASGSFGKHTKSYGKSTSLSSANQWTKWPMFLAD